MLFSQIFLHQLKKEPFSAVTTAIGVILMVYSPHLWLYLVLVFLALLQKYLIKVENRHIFNPSNFAILILVLLFGRFGAVSGGTLGHNQLLWIFTLFLAIWILYRVDRWVLSLVFGVAYLFFENLFIVGYDYTTFFEDIFERFYSVSFILFILFMLTDPATTPKSKTSQAIFAVLIALVASLLDRYFGFKSWHIFFALSLISPLTPIFDQKRLYFQILWIELALILATLYISFRAGYYLGVPN